MRLKFGLLAAISASLSSGPVLSADGPNKAIVLTPSSKWNVDFGDEKCRLARIFGEGENRHILFMDQGGPRSSFDLSIGGPAFKRFKDPQRIETRFGELPSDAKRTPMMGQTAGVGMTLVYSGFSFGMVDDRDEAEADDAGVQHRKLPQLDVDQARMIDHVTVSSSGRSIILETGNLADPVAVLNSCTRGMLQVWGLDPVEHDTLTRLPRWLNRKEIVRAIVARYPAKALRKGEQGIFRMRVTVEKDGSVSECDLDSATITESLQSPACREMLQARFAPALDKDGQPMRSFRMTNIVYKIG